MTNTRPLDPSPWDEAVAIAEDLYHHVNGRWLADNPGPAEYLMWGAYPELHHRSRELTHRLLAEAAADVSAGRGDAVGRRAGDCFAAGMDEGAIAAAGVEPLRPYLDLIDATALLEVLRTLTSGAPMALPAVQRANIR